MIQEADLEIDEGNKPRSGEGKIVKGVGGYELVANLYIAWIVSGLRSVEHIS